MSEEYQTVERNREEGSIGIGAMIVFIALILVAAVASTIIIKTAEELQQNAEQTSSDTRKEISGKINIIQALVNTSDGDDVNSMVFTAKVASGSNNLLVSNINWVLTCGDASTYGMVAANLGDDSPWGDAIADTVTGGTGGVGVVGTWEDVNAESLAGAHHDANTELSAGTVFKFDINVDYSTATIAAGGACEDLSGVGQTLLLKIVVDDGGTTVTELSIDSLTAGSTVI
jgi:archaellin